MNLIREIWQSIVRRDPLSTDKGKSELVFLNVWLHIHPAKVKKENLKFRHTFYLGFITFFLFLILVTTGIALMCLLPALSAAGLSGHEGPPVCRLHGAVSAQHASLGGARHGDLRLPAHVPGLLHRLLQEAAPVQLGHRRVLFLLTLGLSFTGYLLPWDQLAYWAITVGTNIGSYAPLVGGQLREMLLGGHTVGEAALLRFYVLHVAVLPALVILFTIVHFWRVRKDGGLSRPVWKLNPTSRRRWSPSARPHDRAAAAMAAASKDKTYGLMEVVTGKPIFETSHCRRRGRHRLLLSLCLRPRSYRAAWPRSPPSWPCRSFSTRRLKNSPIRPRHPIPPKRRGTFSACRNW